MDTEASPSPTPAQDVVRQPEEPEIVRLTDADVLQALLFDAHRKRLEVELQNVALQEQAYAARLSQRYGIDMAKYTIDADVKVARRKEQP